LAAVRLVAISAKQYFALSLHIEINQNNNETQKLYNYFCAGSWDATRRNDSEADGPHATRSDDDARHTDSVGAEYYAVPDLYGR
jgi:hypothetical protein